MSNIYIKVIAIVFITILLTIDISIADQNNNSLILYHNDIYNYELFYDSSVWSWYKKRGDSGIEFHKDSSKGIDNVVTVYIQVKDNVGTRKELLKFANKNPKAFIQELTKVFPDAKLLNSRETFLGNFPAYSINYKYTLRNLNFEGL